MPNHFRLLLLLYWLRYGPPVQARVQRALQASTTDTASATDVAGVSDLMTAIRRAARWVPGSRCLDQALACWTFAQHRGLPVKLHLGIRRQPHGTTAHAWISVGAQAIGEDPDALRQLLPLQAGAVSDLHEFD